MTTDTTFVDSGRAQLASETGGTGSVDVLLLHAGVADRTSWRALTDRLGHLARWVSFDARGYGETRYEREDGWSPVADALAVMSAHGMPRPVVIGGSMGGRTAIDLALLHPDRLSGLVLVAPAIGGAPDLDLPAAVVELDERIGAAEAAGDLAAANRGEAHLWLDGPLQPEGRVGGVVREAFLAGNGAALAADYPGDPLREVVAWDRLSEIAVPTLVLVGEHDIADMRDNPAHLARVVRRGRLVDLPGVAHLPQLEGDRRLLDEVAAFVEQVSRGG